MSTPALLRLDLRYFSPPDSHISDLIGTYVYFPAVAPPDAVATCACVVSRAAELAAPAEDTATILARAFLLVVDGL